jgi:hypothetical protein
LRLVVAVVTVRRLETDMAGITGDRVTGVEVIRIRDPVHAGMAGMAGMAGIQTHNVSAV